MNTIIFSSYDDCYRASAILINEDDCKVIDGEVFPRYPYVIYETDGFGLFDFFKDLFKTNIDQIIVLDNARIDKIRTRKSGIDEFERIMNEDGNLIATRADVEVLEEAYEKGLL